MQIPKKNWLEWAVFAVSLLVVLGALGGLLYGAATGGDSSPQITVLLGQPERQEAGFVVPVTLRNSGNGTAEGVQVEVTLERGGAQIEKGSFEVPFLPRGSSGEGWVLFANDPATGTLRGAVRGYEKP